MLQMSDLSQQCIEFWFLFIHLLDHIELEIAFSWKLLIDRIPTRGNIACHNVLNLDGSRDCPLCQGHEENQLSSLLCSCWICCWFCRFCSISERFRISLGFLVRSNALFSPVLLTPFYYCFIPVMLRLFLSVLLLVGWDAALCWLLCLFLSV